MPRHSQHRRRRFRGRSWSSQKKLCGHRQQLGSLFNILLWPLPVLPVQRLYHKNKGSSWFCARCGHIYKWRHGSRNLSLRYGSEQDDVSLYKAFQMPQAVQPGQLGEVEPFFTSLRLTPNVMDNHLPYEVQTDGASSHRVETTCGMIQRIKTVMTRDNVN